MSDRIRAAQGSQAADQDKCPKHGGYNIPGEAECAGCTWGDLVAKYQGSVAGKRAIGVAHSYAGRTHREGTAEYFYAAIDSLDGAMAVIAEAVAALSLFGGVDALDLASATRLLSMWHYNKHLDAAQRAAILEHFTPGGAR